eukprot:UN22263
MNLFALAQDVQNQVCFIAQEIAEFLCDIHTCIVEIKLRFCNNFYLLQMRGEQRKSRRLKDPIQKQEGKQIIYTKVTYLYSPKQILICR